MTDTTERAAWLEERRRGIGGSDVAAVLGLNPYKTPLDLWEDKTGKAEESHQSESAYWGSTLEDVVAKEFSMRTGMKVQRLTKSLSVSFDAVINDVPSEARGWARANIDRAVINPTISKTVRLADECAATLRERCNQHGLAITTDAILECKTANARMADEWGPSQEAEIVAGTVTSEHKIPIYYETQVQWYMAVTGARVAYVAVLIGGQDFRIYVVRRDDELIRAIVTKCWEFWRDHVMTGTPPDPTTVEDVKKLFAKDDGELREATNDEAAEIGELRNLDAQIKDLEEQRKAVASKVILAIGKSAGLMIGGEKAVTYKTQTSRRFDSTAFKKNQPAIYADYCKETMTRVLRVA